MNKYLELALDAATKSKCRQKHGCVVVSNGRIVGVATNKKVGNPETHWRRSHIHAEVAALLAAGKYAYGSSVYVARISAAGTPAESRPCKGCYGYLERFGVAKVVWT